MQVSIIIVCLLVAGPLLIALVRTLVIKSQVRRKSAPKQNTHQDTKKEDIFADHLSSAVTFQTVASKDSQATEDSVNPFIQFHRFLEQTFPQIHTKLARIDVGDRKNLVFCWEGTDLNRLPALLMAHQDVVPAEEEGWTYPPFDKHIADGYVWGRGSFDSKGQLIAILETIENLLINDFQPLRTWYVAFGWDEETRGSHGARSIVEHFISEKIRFAFVLDEGGVVANGFVPGITAPIAVIGIAEKGNLNLKLSCTKEGGHSSSPKNPTAVGTLGRAIWRLETSKSRAQLGVPVRLLLRTLGEQAPFYLAVLLLNLWLFKPILIAFFSASPSMNALVRTTLAITMIKGSNAENIIARIATAIANIRMLPEESTEDVIAKIRKIISDESIEISVLSDSKRSRISKLDSEGFALITKTIEQVFAAVPTPFLMTGSTDALYYEAVSDHVYRFTPAAMDTTELQRMHNVDERFSLENLGKAVQFYTALITQDSQK